jgi:hypothetical protein
MPAAFERTRRAESRAARFVMPSRAVVVTAVTLVLLGAMYAVFKGAAGHRTSPPQERTYRLRIEDQRLTSGPAILEAVQGDSVTLIVTSNRKTVLHVHEYEQHLVMELEPGHETTATFIADRSGRFGIHLIGPDGSHAEVAAVEVQPR